MQVLSLSQNQKGDWSEFLVENNGHFLQSWQWGELQKKEGRKVWRLAIKDRGVVALQAQIIKHNLPLGKSFFYIPFRPLLSDE